jgi:hypothetical protein
MQVIIAAVLLLLVAVVGYAIPKDAPGTPVRILLENNGGKILFTHSTHIDYTSDSCSGCHHEHGREPGLAMDTAMPCGSCHPGAFDAEYVAQHQALITDEAACVRCHHLENGESRFDHAEHEDYADCTDCHHDTDIEPEPQNCADCHDKEGGGGMPGLRDAAHERCESCHTDMFEAGLDGCASCHDFAPADPAHAPAACASCHDAPVEELVPTRMEAFHGQCMGCHEQIGAGPFGEGACNQCHIN